MKYHELNSDLVYCCALVIRYTILKEDNIKNLARLSIADLEMRIRNEKEKIKQDLNSLNQMQKRIQEAKKCLVKKEGNP